MEPGTRGKAAPIRRADRAFTMMELLVTLGILAVALASVLSIFARGSARANLSATERIRSPCAFNSSSSKSRRMNKSSTWAAVPLIR